jgi:hypothetical protein
MDVCSIYSLEQALKAVLDRALDYTIGHKYQVRQYHPSTALSVLHKDAVLSRPEIPPFSLISSLMREI